ncbi:MAG: peptidoglycan-binding protein [Candidatus Omnitrophica bacterium]|nr:peptidoglycan-binding protein [Candidatus Omnitrophota bacterium]
MLHRILLVILVAGSLTGCAATQQSTEVSQLQMQVGNLEREVQAKDSEIENLKYEVKDLNYEIEKIRKAPARTVSSRSSSSSADDGEIIRVDASIEDVQKALKNAGYYTGNIDGKLGNQTKQAISNFQKDHNLKADGLIGKKTWSELQTYLE